MEESGLPFERELVDIRSEHGRDDPGFQAASPMGKVPALSDGQVSLADSAAIGLYLADRYPQTGLAPAIDDPQRGRYLYWMLFTPGVIEPAMSERAGGWTPNPTSSGWGDFDTMIATLTTGLDRGPWILGEAFSAADVMIGSSVVFMSMFGMLPDNQALADYAQRCLARPAYQRAMAAEGPADSA
jgi:glutathione S-transferase